MRLLVLNYEYPPLGGGAGRCARYQAEGLAGLGHEVTVITTWFKGEPEVEEHANLRLIRLKSRRRKVFRSNPLEMTSWALHTLRFIRSTRLAQMTDLVLVHFSLPGGMVAVPLNRRYGIPYILISHGQDIPWFSPRELFAYHLVFYLPIRYICARASKVTVLSQQRLRDLHRLTGPKQHVKHLVIPNGCDTDFFTPVETDRDPALLKILFVGRLTRQKDPFTLLRAMGYLREYGTPFSLEIVGDGPLRKKLEGFVAHHRLQSAVHFTGWITREQLREKYRNAHLFLVTSRDEGQSLAMLEAAATGLYLLSTPVSGSESLIQEGVNGGFIPRGQPEKIADCLRAYFKEKVTRGYRIPGDFLQSLRERISWDHNVRAYDQLVRS